MKKCSVNENLIATGGIENDLKLWNIENETNNSIFKAKNVSDNWIQLREPVWVMCIDFYENDKVAVGTAYHQVKKLFTQISLNMHY
jgi:ribosome biogenesis protein NSA1